MEIPADEPGPSKRVHSDGDDSTGISSEETSTDSPISALYNVFTVLVHCLDPDPILANLLGCGFSPITIQDIREERRTSDRNRKLIEEVRKGGCEAYLKLKRCLQDSGQLMICSLLERTEMGEDTSDLQRELLEEAREKMRRAEEENRLYTEFKDELVRFYKTNESMIPASPLVEDHAVPLTELYVQPPMSAFIKPNAFGQGKKPLEKTPVSSYRQLFLKDDKKAYSNIYMEANAGYGKTSFAQKVAMTWCQPHLTKKKKFAEFVDVDTIQRFDLLFLLHLRNFQDEDICLLDELVIKCVAQSLPGADRFSENFIRSMLRTRPCLIVCDGLDEWTHPSRCKRKPGIPHNNSGDNCTVLTKTRSWKISTIGLTPNLIDRHVDFLQLNEATSKELKSNAVKLLSDNSGTEKPDLTDFDRKISAVKLEDIRFIPYILLQLICIWFDGLSIGKSKCETYSNTIELTLERGLKKGTAPTIPTGNQEHNVTVPECTRQNELCKQYMNLLLKLGKLAFYRLFQKIKESSLVIESTTVLKDLTEEELEFCLKIGLLSQTKDRSIISRTRYQVFFQHKSIQEFLAALYITSEWNTETIKLTILEICSSLSSILEMGNLFVFVCGMNPEIYTCISDELQNSLDLDNYLSRYRTYTYIVDDDDPNYSDDSKTMKSYQSMQLECLQESLRNGNDSCPIPLYFVLDKHRLTYDLTALKQINDSNGTSPQVSFNEKIVAFMLSQFPVVFIQSLDPGVFTSLQTLRVEDCCKEPVWLADILTESARTLKCLTLSRTISQEYSSLSSISITALTGLPFLQSLYLNGVDVSHDNYKCLYAYICQTTTLTQLRLEFIGCSDHEYPYSDCDVTLDLRRLNKLKTLHLHIVQCTELRVNVECLEKLEFRPQGENLKASASETLWQDLRGAPVLSILMLCLMTSCQEMKITIPTLTQLQYFGLENIDISDAIPRFSPAMTKLERIELAEVTMSSSSCIELFLSAGQLPRSITVKLSHITMTSQDWRELLLSIGQLQHPVTVELEHCQGPSREEWEIIVNVIRSTPLLSLLPDLSIDRSASLTLNKAV